jgi:hypothetical protein
MYGPGKKIVFFCAELGRDALFVVTGAQALMPHGGAYLRFFGIKRHIKETAPFSFIIMKKPTLLLII